MLLLVYNQCLMFTSGMLKCRGGGGGSDMLHNTVYLGPKGNPNGPTTLWNIYKHCLDFIILYDTL